MKNAKRNLRAAWRRLQEWLKGKAALKNLRRGSAVALIVLTLGLMIPLSMTRAQDTTPTPDPTQVAIAGPVGTFSLTPFLTLLYIYAMCLIAFKGYYQGIGVILVSTHVYDSLSMLTVVLFAAVSFLLGHMRDAAGS